MKRPFAVTLSLGLLLALMGLALALMARAGQPGAGSTDPTYQTSRFLALRNATADRLKVWVQYSDSEVGNEKQRSPGAPAAPAEPILFQLPPRTVTFLDHNGAKVRTDRVRLWAESENGWTWPAHPGEDLWLVEKDASGQRRYQADQVETFTRTFDAPKDDITFHERSLHVHNSTSEVLRVEAQALARGPDGKQSWRLSATATVRPGQKLPLRGLDGWLLRGSQVRLWAQDAGGRLYRWWSHQEEPISLVKPEGYQARQIGTARFVFEMPNDNPQPPAEEAEPVFRLQPDQVQVPNVVGIKVDAAGVELAKVGLKAGFEEARPGADDLVTSQEPAAGWRYLVPEVLLKAEAAVPNVVGRTYAEAKTELEAAGLVPSTTEEEPKGVVSGQDPVAETLVEKGSKVKLSFEEQSDKIKVPNLVGRTFDDARDDLDGIGLKIDSDMTAGRVEAQDPAADTPVERGTTVKVTVRAPEGMITVPDLVGKTFEDAQKALEGARLKIVSADETVKGIVESQDPPADTPVAEGATVKVVLQEEKAKVAVPDVVGKTLEEAGQILEAASLQIGGTEETQPGRGVTVESQDPPAGASVDEGSTVMVAPGPDAPAKVPVPNVVGMKCQDARIALEAMKLVIDPDAVAATGLVESQDPPAGTEVTEGDMVTLELSTEPESEGVEPPEQPSPAQPPLPPATPSPVDDPPDNQPVDNQPVDNQPVDNQPVDNQPVDNQPVDNGPDVGNGPDVPTAPMPPPMPMPTIPAPPVVPPVVPAPAVPPPVVPPPAGPPPVIPQPAAPPGVPPPPLPILNTVELPEVVGLSFDRARLRILAAGLRFQPQGDPKASVAKSQFPDAVFGAARVLRGSVVVVGFANAETVVVPKVVNLPFDQAQKALEARGLTAQPQGDPKQSPVRTQMPAADTRILKGSPVIITFAPDQVRVPNVVDSNLRAAQKTLTAAGLAIRVQGDPKRGPARSQVPAVGTLAARGSAVNVFFGAKDDIRVPNVIGLSLDDVRKRIEGAGLVLVTKGDPKLGPAKSQAPAVGTLVPRGAKVTVVFAAPVPVRVPDVVGKTSTQAQQLLQRLGLLMKVQGDPKQGPARSQTPPAGALVARGSTVTVVFGSAQQVRVPSVLGLNSVNARSRIESVGLVIKMEGDTKNGVARSQTPAESKLVARGSTVTVVFGPPALVRVPDVIGADRARARQTLEKARLAIKIQGDPAGSARTESPRAGMFVLAGTKVTVVFGRVPQVRVPNLIGADLARARQVLAEAGLALQFKGVVRTGTVRNQSPAEGTLVARGSSVTAAFSAVSLVHVPRVIGLDYAQAQTRLEPLGLRPKAEGDSKARVRSQSPVEGAQVTKGSTITLVFPGGPKLVRVPTVLGLSQAQAKKRLAPLGLVIDARGDQKGSARSQSPLAGTEVTRGSTITVVFPPPGTNPSSAGTKTPVTGNPPPKSPPTKTPDLKVLVPNVVGQPYYGAENRLQSRGLKFRAQGNRDGRVSKQTPVAGTLVPRGSTVVCVLQPATTTVQGPPSGTKTPPAVPPTPGKKTPPAVPPVTSVRVPSVAGASHDRARSQLEALGLVLKAHGDPNGVVRTQSPAAGALVPRGSFVTVIFAPAPAPGAQKTPTTSRARNITGRWTSNRGDTNSGRGLDGATWTFQQNGNSVSGSATDSRGRVATLSGSFNGTEFVLNWRTSQGSGTVRLAFTNDNTLRGTFSYSSDLKLAPKNVVLTRVGASAGSAGAVPPSPGKETPAPVSGPKVGGPGMPPSGGKKTPPAGPSVSKGGAPGLVPPSPGKKKPPAPIAGTKVGVPSVIGAGHASARARLEGLGFVVRTHGNVNGLVRSQSPPPGTQAARGSSVTLVFRTPATAAKPGTSGTPVSHTPVVTGTWVCHHGQVFTLRQSGEKVSGYLRNRDGGVANLWGTCNGTQVVLNMRGRTHNGINTWHLSFNGPNSLRGTWTSGSGNGSESDVLSRR